MASTFVSWLQGSTWWVPRLRVTPRRWRKCAFLRAFAGPAGLTSSWSRFLTPRRRTTGLWKPTTASTRITSTSATPWWLTSTAVRRGWRSRGGGTTLSCPADLRQPGCSNIIKNKSHLAFVLNTFMLLIWLHLQIMMMEHTFKTFGANLSEIKRFYQYVLTKHAFLD